MHQLARAVCAADERESDSRASTDFIVAQSNRSQERFGLRTSVIATDAGRRLDGFVHPVAPTGASKRISLTCVGAFHRSVERRVAGFDPRRSAQPP